MSISAGETITSGGHGFIGIGRKRMLEILQDRARELGVTLHFEAECDPADPKWREYDLVIASDGANSRFRDADDAAFGVDVDVRANKFVWLGTSKVFDAFTFAFEETAHGWIWAHAYRFAPDCSTFIVECSEETWRAFGFDKMSQDESIAACEKLFAKYLDGHALQSNASHLVGSAAWLNFKRIKCDRWSSGNVILLGDAAHTAHFSIGSGTKLALEDAIKLAEVLEPRPGAQPRSRARRISGRAEPRGAQAPEQRAQLDRMVRNARPLSPFRAAAIRLFAAHPLAAHQPREPPPARPRMAGGRRALVLGEGRRPGKSAAPMFAPFKLRALTLENRITVSPMAMYSAVEGAPGDFHFVHYGERALGGAGLLFTEMTCVSPEGRISPGCTGMWNADHVAAWKRIVDFVHANSKAKICLQLGHSGGKGSTKLGWEGNDVPLDDGNWPVMAASDVRLVAGQPGAAAR